ncbi:MAG: phosphodiester glycosidase family protein [Candidatus Eremiobacteraeota bacterium]|nr:phosphodiester glycosidase family protein [Candidatus Eremiobacteraeota bacterium]
MHLYRWIFAFVIALAPVGAHAKALPQVLDPQPPFPRIIMQTPAMEVIAPGVTFGQYALLTEAGPIVANVIAVAPNHSDIAVDSGLASDALTSNGETVSSMARRTNAVAGINGDYFDIGNTYRPTNILVRGGRLLLTPRKRYSLVIPRSGPPQIVENTFSGTLQLADRTVTLDAINEMPPPGGGVALLTPEFGTVAPQENLTLIGLVPTSGTPPFSSYRVTAVEDNLTRQPAGYYAAIGLNAYGNAGVPNPGDSVSAAGDLSPVAAANIVAAVGGGPLILRGGEWYDDPDGPSGGEYAARIPCSGTAVQPDGTLLLIEIDGREPDRSVGVTRREFASFMRALGASDGLAFDGGGSSAIAVRDLGSPQATLRNRPSDGRERPVADGVFVYNTAPVGSASQIVANPAEVRTLGGASVDVRVATIDRNDHAVAAPRAITAAVEPSSLGIYRDGRFTAQASGTGAIVFRSGSLETRLPLAVFNSPARIEILPRHPNVAVNGRYRLAAQAFDMRGYRIALPALLPWRANEGRITPDGTFDAASHDATVSLALGTAYSQAEVTVGSHDVPLAFNDAHFSSVPRGGTGGVSEGPDGLELHYALGPQERAAYLATDVALPQGTTGLSFAVRDDGSGLRLRVSLRNALNEQLLITAANLDRPGWRRVTASLPENLGGSARLSAIYIIGGNAEVLRSGSIAIRDLRAIVAGSP